jgi:hypothetical protein
MEDRQEKEVLMGHEGRLRYDPAGGWTEVEDDETHRGTLSVGPKPEDGERNASPSSQGGQAVAFGGSIQRVFLMGAADLGTGRWMKVTGDLWDVLPWMGLPEAAIIVPDTMTGSGAVEVPSRRSFNGRGGWVLDMAQLVGMDPADVRDDRKQLSTRRRQSLRRTSLRGRSCGHQCEEQVAH